jgi:hypothetical protein
MSPPNDRGRPGEKAAPTVSVSDDKTKVPRPAGIPQQRRPCRTPGCPGDRPIVPVGACRAFDRCSRCTGAWLTSLAPLDWSELHEPPDWRWSGMYIVEDGAARLVSQCERTVA